MNLTEKLQITIYKIISEEGSEYGIDAFEDILNQYFEDKGHHACPQQLRSDLSNDAEIKLLYDNSPSNPKWKSFLKAVVNEDQDILREDQSYTESFILLIKNNSSSNLYAVTGGLGYFAIQEFIDENFGVDILSRIIKKEDKILKAVKEKTVIGGILGSTKHFRNTYNLFENDEFGKIYQELTANINKTILVDHFGFTDSDLKNQSVCVAKSSFKICKPITFDQIKNIINGCEFVLENIDPISINNVTKVPKKKNQSLVADLEKELNNQLWKRYKDKHFINFDLCHKDYEKYLTAAGYEVRLNNSKNNYFGDYVFERLDNIDNLFEQLDAFSKSPGDEEEFQKLLSSLRIITLDDEGREVTKGKVIQHIFGDVEYCDNRYFFVDNSWYKIEDSFLKDLNDSCKSFFNESIYNGLNKPWRRGDSETDYNRGFIGDSNSIVLHTITPKNIEPCDILQWDDENLYLVHVKEGFENTVRDLCSQIYISANKLQTDIHASQEYIEEIYISLVKKKDAEEETYDAELGLQSNAYSKEEFKNLFVSKKIVFVMAVADSANTERKLISELEKYQSSIAKFSLQDLVKKMKAMGIEFQYVQITKG